MAESIPVTHGPIRRIAACYRYVVVLADCFEQGRQSLRWMLKVGINHTKQVGIGVLPPVNDRACQATLSDSHQQADSGVAFCVASHELSSSILAVIVHYDQLVRNSDRCQRVLNTIDERGDVTRLIEGRNN